MNAVMMFKLGFGTMTVAGLEFIAYFKWDGSTDNGLFDVFKYMAACQSVRQIGNELRGRSDNAVILPAIAKGKRGGDFNPRVGHQAGPVLTIE